MLLEDILRQFWLDSYCRSFDSIPNFILELHNTSGFGVLPALYSAIMCDTWLNIIQSTIKQLMSEMHHPLLAYWCSNFTNINYSRELNLKSPKVNLICGLNWSPIKERIGAAKLNGLLQNLQ